MCVCERESVCVCVCVCEGERIISLKYILNMEVLLMEVK